MKRTEVPAACAALRCRQDEAVSAAFRKRRAMASAKHRAAAAAHTSVRSTSVFGGGGGVPLHSVQQHRKQRFTSGGMGSIFSSARAAAAGAAPWAGLEQHGAAPGASFVAGQMFGAFPSPLADAGGAAAAALPVNGARTGLNRFGEALSLLGRAAGGAGHGGSFGVGGRAAGSEALEVREHTTSR